MPQKIILLIAVLFLPAVVFAGEGEIKLDDLPIETFVLEPVRLEYSSFWVPAAKNGPFINRSCRPKQNLSFSSVLPATVNHTKTDGCLDEVARILAENTSLFHRKSLPLTIFNGWQWEYSYSLCQFESVSYDLDRRGGSWENCWEAILSVSFGQEKLSWLVVYSLGKYENKKNTDKQVSEIEIITFSSMRIRDGYPKQRKL